MSLRLRAALVALTLVLFAVVISGQNPVSVFQWGSTAVQTGSGTATGALRVELANNGTGLLTAAQATAANFNATVVGTGTFAVQAAESGTWTVQPGNTANTTAWLFAGGKTNNNAAPGATNIGALSGIANAAAPTWTEGNLVLSSTDLHGSTRMLALDSSGNVITPSVDATTNTTTQTTGPQQFLNGSTATPSAAGADGRSIAAWGDLVGRLHLTGDASMSPLLVQTVPGTASGLTTFVLEAAASDNHTNIKNGAGVVYHVTSFNNSATINYYRLYNAASGFNGCNSATNLLWEGLVPASTSGGGFVEDIGAGITFSTGISICITGAFGNTNTTNATASAILFNLGYK